MRKKLELQILFGLYCHPGTYFFMLTDNNYDDLELHDDPETFPDSLASKVERERGISRVSETN